MLRKFVLKMTGTYEVPEWMIRILVILSGIVFLIVAICFVAAIVIGIDDPNKMFEEVLFGIILGLSIFIGYPILLRGIFWILEGTKSNKE